MDLRKICRVTEPEEVQELLGHGIERTEDAVSLCLHFKVEAIRVLNTIHAPFATKEYDVPPQELPEYKEPPEITSFFNNGD